MRPFFLKSINPDVIVEMLEMACRLEKWNKVIETAEILYECVQCLYQEQQYRKAKSLPMLTFELEHPMVYYYGFSHLMRGMACQEKGLYEESRAYIDKYAELGWLEDLGEDGLEVVEEFDPWPKRMGMRWSCCLAMWRCWLPIPIFCGRIPKKCYRGWIQFCGPRCGMD
ncbi:hypothetical protein NST07_33825 [Paenibacillus sp. FSL L8-0340]|uniref:hypothetical protein n=1 Tax=Paenibacillus sp. FSL L8-0340 TaxID=2954685 RepID=UPI0031595111